MIAIEVVGWTLILVGAATMLVAAVGLHRLGTPAARLHVAAKATSTGILGVLLGAALLVDDGGARLELIATGIFLVVSVPLSTHALGRVFTEEEARKPTD